MRLCFLFNHDQIHQVAHSLPIALALATEGWPGPIIVATTNERLAAEVRRLGGPAIGTIVEYVELRPSFSSRLLDGVLRHLIPSTKLLIYRDNLEFFRSLDILVVAEKTSLLLKTRYGLDRPRIVHTRHGAGDRAIGFDAASAGFDHVLCSGPLIRDRLVSEAGLAPERISIVGYPKFDLAPPPLPSPSDRPRVLYNPHPSPHLSSWYRDGRAVLDFFAAQDRFELIFAPHVMLFHRRFAISLDKLRIARPGRIQPRHMNHPNILVDRGSQASTDMRYTAAADIYLGDASSQVYEFLKTPRPCLFLDSHRTDWQGNPNFAHWQAGPVITSPAELERGLERAIERHPDRYKSIQAALFAERIEMTDTPASKRAAAAIRRFAMGADGGTAAGAGNPGFQQANPQAGDDENR